MKRYTKVLPILITIGFLMIFFLPSVKGFDDIEYVFQKDSLYNNDNVNNQFNETFNLRNQTYMDLGNYPATYTFENDDNGSEPFGWSTTIGGGTIQIISNKSGHNKVLEFLDNSGGFISATQTFQASQSIGKVELWFETTDVSKRTFIRIREGSTVGIHLAVRSNELQYNDGIWNSIVGISNNILYHLRIDFDCTSDDYDIFLNSVEYGTFDFDTVLSSVDNLRLESDATHQDYYSYFDAIGYSWDFGYNTLFDFTSDTVGNEPIGWTSDNSGGATTLIKASLDGRSNILEIYDNGWGSTPNIYTNTTNSTLENFTFEFATNDTSEIEMNIFFSEVDLIIIQFHILFDDVFYVKSGIHLIKSNFITNNEFFSVRVELNNLLGIFDVYINDILEGSDLPYVNNITNGINRITIEGHNIHPSDPQYSGYIDNIVFDLTPSLYSIGDNIFPIQIETEYLEVDKFEFAMESINSLYISGYHAIVSGFEANEYQTGTVEVLNMGSAPENFNNRLMDLEVVDTSDSAVLTNTEINNTAEFIEVSFDFELIAGNNNDAHVHFLILPYDGLMVAKLRIDFSDMKLYYDNGAGYTELKDNLVLNANYIIVMKISYEIDICTYSLYQESILIDTESFPLLEIDEIGLFAVIVDLSSDDDSAQLYLDNIGIYNSSQSISTDFGWSYFNFEIVPPYTYWNSDEQNIFKYTSNGSFEFKFTSGDWYAIGETSYIIKGLSVYNDTETIRNTYGMEVNLIQPIIVFTVQGNNFKLESLSIEGSYLQQDTNKYYLDFSSGGVGNESYFYVDSSNNLRFTHTVDQEGVNEFIQASFDIQDKSSTNTVISFLSDIDANAYGFFRVNFTTTSFILQIENTLKTKRVSLVDGLTINSFVILVSDTNKNQIEGITEGLVSNIALLDIESSMASVITLNLIDMIIPLIIILLPTLSISKLYGDFLIVPLFLMFSLILAITGLLPIWLFFVVLVSSALFIFFEKDNKRMV